MPWSNQAIDLIIIQAVISGFTGLFIYDPAPANGTLIISETAAAGEDPDGNIYQAGVTSYLPGNTGVFSQLLNGGLTLANSAADSEWIFTAGETSPTATPDLIIEQSGNASRLMVQAPVSPATGPAVLVGVPNSATGAPEAWHTLSLNAGFAALAGFAAPRYRFEPMGSGGVVRLDGALSLTANQAVGAAFATLPALPANYRPAFSKYFLTGNSLSGGVGTEVESVRVINATGGGFLELGSNGITGNYVLLEGITFPLD